MKQPTLVLIAASITLVAALVLAVIARRDRPAPFAKNELALGDHAADEGPKHVDIGDLVDLNFKSKAEILAMRSREVAIHRDLLARDYVPNPEVFGRIEDGRPWWGIQGYRQGRQGMDSLLGKAFHSQSIVNPFLLVVADVRPSARVSYVGFADSALYAHAKNLQFWPRARRAAVVYDATGFLRGLGLPATDSLEARLIALNARDLGFDFVQVSQGTAPRGDPPFAIPQYLHSGSSCQYPGGCNNQSPLCPGLDSFHLRALPERLTVRLWREMPGAGIPADLEYTIDFE
jgi:hypothetical protein